MLGQTGTKAYISEETTGIIAKVKTDGTNNALVVTQNSQPLPAGGATSDNQTNGDQKAQIIHADGSAGAIITAIDYVAGKSGIDSATEVLSTIDYAHHEIHSGNHFIYRCYATLAKAGVKEYLIVTPAGTKWCHMVIGFEIVTSQTVVELFEKVTTSDDGTLANTNNRNRNFADNNTTKIYIDPTVTGGAVAGNLIQCGIFGAGKGSAGGAARDNEEIVLAPGTKYLVRFTEQNLAATAINFFADWYEHTDKN